MKKTLLTSLPLCFVLIGQSMFAGNEHQNPMNGYTRCATMEHLEWMKTKDAGLEARMASIEEQTQAYLKSNPPKTLGAVVRIPTVVHVVYNTSAQNLSDVYICQQIDVLNKDFRKLNSDWTNTPSVFQSLVADCEIEFCLATKDPTGATTNGIIHKQTSTTSFSQNDGVKSSSTGGSDTWDATKYLNIWVCNLGGGLLGYAQFPGGSASTDGVVVLYSSLPGPPSAAPYDLGRTTTHEVGHWLNLRHINGDSNCGNDQVSDTPTQDQLHFGCPTAPYHVNTCSGSSNGEMFMNYMDYVDDVCMVMFSAGQKARMQACLSSSRSGLGAATATKCAATNTPNCATGIDDILAETAIDLYPNPSTGDIFMNVNIPNITSANVAIYNALGEAVMQKKITIPQGSEVKLDMNSNPDGMYLVRIKTTEGTLTKKVVINR